MQLTVDNLPTGYRRVLDAVVCHGHDVAPRGEPTRELLSVEVVVLDTAHTLPVGTGRRVRPSLADEEALQLIAGVHMPERLRFTAPDHVNDPALECYGPLSLEGIERSVRFLQEDPSTRRAVANIGHTGGDSGYPCLASMGWILRNGRLHAFADWRSNDAWLGMPYDVHAIASLQRTMARFLGVLPGPLHHYARSLHLYTHRADSVAGITLPVVSPRPTLEVPAEKAFTWPAVRRLAFEALEVLSV